MLRVCVIVILCASAGVRNGEKENVCVGVWVARVQVIPVGTGVYS